MAHNQAVLPMAACDSVSGEVWVRSHGLCRARSQSLLLGLQSPQRHLPPGPLPPRWLCPLATELPGLPLQQRGACWPCRAPFLLLSTLSCLEAWVQPAWGVPPIPGDTQPGPWLPLRSPGLLCPSELDAESQQVPRSISLLGFCGVVPGVPVWDTSLEGADHALGPRVPAGFLSVTRELLWAGTECLPGTLGHPHPSFQCWPPLWNSLGLAGS